MILLKIDVAKIDKSKLFRGAKGTYLDLVIMENRDGTDRYGNDYMVVQGVSKEDRLAGNKGAILGNGKNVGQRSGGGGRGQGRVSSNDHSKSAADLRAEQERKKPAAQEDEDNIPF